MMEKVATLPAVASDKPSPRAIDVVPHMPAGYTVSVNGLPLTCCGKENRYSEGTIVRGCELDFHFSATADIPTLAEYSSLIFATEPAANQIVPVGEIVESDDH
jgi:hypothetical protein